VLPAALRSKRPVRTMPVRYPVPFLCDSTHPVLVPVVLASNCMRNDIQFETPTSPIATGLDEALFSTTGSLSPKLRAARPQAGELLDRKSQTNRSLTCCKQTTPPLFIRHKNAACMAVPTWGCDKFPSGYREIKPPSFRPGGLVGCQCKPSQFSCGAASRRERGLAGLGVSRGSMLAAAWETF
jgi:hypothetical protein